MKITVCITNQPDQKFDDVACLSFYTGRNNNTGKAVAQWTKYFEDRGSEEQVNLDPSFLVISAVEVIDGQMYAFATQQ